MQKIYINSLSSFSIFISKLRKILESIIITDILKIDAKFHITKQKKVHSNCNVIYDKYLSLTA